MSSQCIVRRSGRRSGTSTWSSPIPHRSHGQIPIFDSHPERNMDSYITERVLKPIESLHREIIVSLRMVARTLYSLVFPDNEISDSNLEYYITGQGHETVARTPRNLTPEHRSAYNEVLSLVGRLNPLYIQISTLTDTQLLYITEPLLNRGIRSTWTSSTMQTYLTNLLNDCEAKAQLRQMIRLAFDNSVFKVKRLVFVLVGECLEKSNNTTFVRFPSGESMSVTDFNEEIRSVWRNVIRAQTELFTEDIRERDGPSMDTTLEQPIDDCTRFPVFTNETSSVLNNTATLDAIPPIPSGVTVVVTPNPDYTARDFAPTMWELHYPEKMRGVIKALKNSSYTNLGKYAEQYAQKRWKSSVLEVFFDNDYCH